MNSKQLTDEYLKATNKANWVRVTAKKFGVAGSDIICELMKCGYKYAELKRVSESQYNSAVNKYHKWQEDGCPETELVPVEPEAEEKNSVIFTLENEEETAAVVIEEVIKPNALDTLESYEKSVELLNSEVQRLQKENAEYQQRVDELERKLAFYEDEKDGDGAIIEDQNAVIYELREKLKSCEQFILNQVVYNP